MARKTKAQALETKQQIIQAAICCFSEQGVAGTSLSQIAACAGVTRGAIYGHFKNKTGLIKDIWSDSDHQLELLEQEFIQTFPDDPLSQLKAFLVSVLRSAVTDLHRRAIMEILFHKCEFVGEMAPLVEIQQIALLECYPKIEQKLQRAKAMTQLPEALNTRRAAIIIRAYISGLIENWLFSPGSYDLAAEADELVDTLMDLLKLSPSLQRPSCCQAPLVAGSAVNAILDR